jgi:hypothetical protein
MMDINPLYWSFRWGQRGRPRSAADKAFVRFFWRMNLVLLFAYTAALVFWGIQLFFFQS